MKDIRLYIDDIEWKATDKDAELPSLVRLDFAHDDYRSDFVVSLRLKQEYGHDVVSCRMHAVTDEEEPEQVDALVEDIGCTATLQNIVWDTTDENGVDQRNMIDPEDIPDEMFVDFTGYSNESDEQLQERAIEEASGDWSIISADVEVKTHD